MSTPNRLAAETSLYLRQHAHNPVDWYPWGPEAFARARELDRPIFLSIGYSACHWCHVMERECFENPAIAAVMNAEFVNVKVDREERPDVDDIYMKAVQLLNQGQGGWPMSVWLTPDQKPFHAGTYFPPADRYGRPGFPRLLAALATAWKERKDEIVRTAGQITDHLRGYTELPPADPAADPADRLRKAAAILARAFDRDNGGFGQQPKFPHALDLSVLLRAARRFGDADALNMVTLTLDRMARGGLYDQLGGGFHRYSVDAEWLVPHFEKMLYDNALLAVTYLEAYQMTGQPFYRQIVEETLDYTLREMTSPAGGFYSTQDADSEGEEGKFYVWSEAELRTVLGPDAGFAAAVWGVTAGGNFEGHNILFRRQSDAADAAALGMSEAEFAGKLADVRRRLFEARERRVKPGRDEKLLAGWNGLMIAAFARCGAALGRADYVAAAVRAAEFVETRLTTPDGRLYRTCGEEAAAKLNGYLEDYTAVALAYSHLFDATLDDRWLDRGAALMRVVMARFADPDGGYFTTPDDHEALVYRPKDVHDGSTPCGNALAVTALARLAHQTGDEALRNEAERQLARLAGLIDVHPGAAGQLLIAADFLAGPVQEVGLIGDPRDPVFQSVARSGRERFLPGRVYAAAAGRPGVGPVTLYLCENATCRQPVSDPAAAIELLR